MPKTFFHSIIITTLLCFLLNACSKPPIRHLSAEVCLIAQGNGQQEVTAVMGQPSQKVMQDGEEQWIYITPQKSFLKRIYLLNLIAGTIDYEIVYITFNNGTVTKSMYYQVTEEEFKKSHLAMNPETDSDEF